ncbi:hypothetical protein BTN49_0318 (plasmid) [Candidatus Enterovibrio escicola]|uniref:Uncharacterized protein n=1 Tax=Candidatus Enterovibrio escicola TaxID=1927127 RepID=A0A2A5T747_9GAMM|nr:hypothetical protein BTN49_0318 [Candidatus Enterovibrio escacola]
MIVGIAVSLDIQETTSRNSGSAINLLLVIKTLKLVKRWEM